MPRSVTTFLMFQGSAEEAIKLYTSTFKGAEVRNREQWKAGEPGPEGGLKRAELSLGGLNLIVFESPAKHEFTLHAVDSALRRVRVRGRARRRLREALGRRRGADAARQLRLQQEVRVDQRPLRRVVAAELGVSAVTTSPESPAWHRPTLAVLWVGGLLAALCPGLGHLYAGRPRAAVFFVFAAPVLFGGLLLAGAFNPGVLFAFAVFGVALSVRDPDHAVDFGGPSCAESRRIPTRPVQPDPRLRRLRRRELLRHEPHRATDPAVGDRAIPIVVRVDGAHAASG